MPIFQRWSTSKWCTKGTTCDSKPHRETTGKAKNRRQILPTCTRSWSLEDTGVPRSENHEKLHLLAVTKVMCMTIQVYLLACRIASTHCQVHYGSNSDNILVKREEELLFLTPAFETGFKKEKAYRTNSAMEQTLNNFVFKQVHFPFYFIRSLLLKNDIY